MDYVPAQTFLRDHSHRELFEKHGISVYPSADGTDVSVNYDQIAAKKTDPMVQECRGLVLHLDSGVYSPDKPLGETHILSRPFKRFFNYGEGGPEHQFDLSNPNVRWEDKLDGTMISLFFNPWRESWQLSTRSVPMADHKVSSLDGNDYTFRTLFEKTVGCELNDWVNLFRGAGGFDTTHTYLFELTTPLNEIPRGVRQDKFSTTILGIRNTQTGEEYDPIPFAERNDINSPKIFNFGSLQEALDYIHSQPPRHHEGMVAKLENRPCHYLRAKVKNASYVAARHAAEGNVASSTRSIMALILSDSFDDVEPILNTTLARVGREMQEKVGEYFRRQDSMYEATVKPGMSRKEVAQACGKAGLNVTACFARYDGKTSNYRGWVATRIQPSGWPHSVLDHLIDSCKG